MKENELHWNFKEAPPNQEVRTILREVKNLHALIGGLLYQRGYFNFEEVKAFFNPNIRGMDGFGVMKDMGLAVSALSEAIAEDKTILLYGDYDVDGTCAVSLMLRTLRNLGANPAFYIPDRYSEGYGVSTKGVDYAIEEKFDLVITLDCGISANRELGRLTEAGIKTIICDHHLPGSQLPNVFAILNPKQSDCSFSGKELCGSGVALMLLKALCESMNRGDLWKANLDLAAVATCCDIVPLTGINRIIVSEGLNRLNAEKSIGLEALLEVANFKEELDVSDVVFKIGPRINAAGRLEHARLAVELLTATDFEEAKSLAQELDALNSRRRALDKQITTEAAAQMRELDPDLAHEGTVVHNPTWNKGVIGIVASRLIEQCYRPTIVFSESKGELTGSARSVEGFNLHQAISECSEYLVRFGGHAAAAGLTIKREDLDAFRSAFNSAVGRNRLPESRVPSIHIDLEIDFCEWYNDRFKLFWSQFNRMRPFGPKNMPPLFATRSCGAKSVKIVGEGHLKFQVFQRGDAKRTIPVIAFGMGDYFDHLNSGGTFELAYSIGSNKWNGKTTLQLDAKDIRVN